MKYALLAILMPAAALAVGALLAFLLKKARHATWSARRQIAISAAFGLVIALIGAGVFLNSYYRADATAQAIVALAHDIADD